MNSERGDKNNFPYWDAAKRYLPVLLVISAAASVVAFVLANASDIKYQAHYSYLVSLSQREAAQEYRFDGFYALQATDLFAATLARWVQTPETIVAAYERAGVALPTKAPRDLTKLMRAEKTAPQLVQVTVEGRDERQARELSRALASVMEENIKRYHDQGIPAVTFGVVATDTWVGYSKISVPIITSATFFFTLFFSLNVLLLWVAGRRDKS